MNIHYKSPIRREEKDVIPEEELRKRQVVTIKCVQFHMIKLFIQFIFLILTIDLM